MSVYVGASLPFSELNALSVSLYNLKHQLQNCQPPIFFLFIVPRIVIISKVQRELLLQEVVALF